MPRSAVYATLPCSSWRGHPFVLHETGPVEPAKPRLLDRVRAAARLRHYSRRTEAAYVAWIRRYILFHGKRQPAELGAAEVTRFLSSLAVDGRVAASTQNQALGALLFLYHDVLELDLPWLDGARGDLKNEKGDTAGDIMSRRRDPDFKGMANELSTLRRRS